jgi:hypothetical protein
MEITLRVHAIPAPVKVYTGPYPPNVYLVVDGGQAAMIDAGFSEEDSVQERLAYLKGLPGLRVAYVVLTPPAVPTRSVRPRAPASSCTERRRRCWKRPLARRRLRTWTCRRR